MTPFMSSMGQIAPAIIPVNRQIAQQNRLFNDFFLVFLLFFVIWTGKPIENQQYDG